MEKEIDKDLTMIQPEPTPEEQSFEELMKSTPADKVKTFDIGTPTTKRGMLDTIQTMKEQAMVSANTTPGEVDSLDSGRSWFEGTDEVRARNQSGLVKFGKALTGGVIQGGLIALEQLGYVADLQTYINMFSSGEDLSGSLYDPPYGVVDKNYVELVNAYVALPYGDVVE